MMYVNNFWTLPINIPCLIFIAISYKELFLH